MCYSAQIKADFTRFIRQYGGDLQLEEFAKIYFERSSNPRIKIPKAVDAAFASPTTDQERDIKGLIDGFNAQQATALEQDLFKQRKRLAHAERSLQTKTTKKATEDVRIATDKIERGRLKLADLSRTELLDRDARFFPGSYAPVIVWEGGRRVVKPMRYQCRLAGKPANYDSRFPGTYNARRDNLEGFWRDLFGYTHGLIVVNRFFEHVDRDGTDVVLEFDPNPAQDMLVACLWSHWTEPGEPDLLSFAAVTDDPPPEVAAAGHNRCIVPIKPENVDAWLQPDPSRLDALYAILDDRERPYYEHRLTA